MKSRLTRLGAAATLVLAAGWTAGCSSADPSAAAIVDGQVIKDADLTTIMTDLKRNPRNADLTSTKVLGDLILAKVVQAHAGELKAPMLSVEAMRAQLEAPDASGKSGGPYAPVTLEAMRDVNVLGAVWQSPSQNRAVEFMQKAQVTVNPKYGEFDAQRLGISPVMPNWMVTPSGGASLPPGHPDVNQPQNPQNPPTPQGNPSTLPGEPTQGTVPATPAPSASGATSPATATTTTK